MLIKRQPTEEGKDKLINKIVENKLQAEEEKTEEEVPTTEEVLEDEMIDEQISAMSEEKEENK